MGIESRYRDVLEQVESCTRACGRDPHEVKLVAVSKTVGLEGVASALAGGAVDFGENRPDQILVKSKEYPQANWHFIGNIQSRRIPDIVASSSLIHSLYQLSHARKIDEEALSLGKVQDVLVEVNVSGEESKSGLAPQDVIPFVLECAELQNVRLRGLMTMAPQGDAQVAKACFDGLAQLACEVREALPAEKASVFSELSMGMSEDWNEAISSGATIVRIGRAIFSDNFEDVDMVR